MPHLPMLQTSRRDWLRTASRQAAWLAWAGLFAAEGQAQTSTPIWRPSTHAFTLGVASGEPRPNSVVIWTRLAPAPLQADGGMPHHAVAVRWEVASDEQFSRVVQRGTVVTDARRAHSVHVDVNGLASDRHYFYRFLLPNQTSPIGRTRTAPAPNAPVSRLRMALASCQHYEMGHFTAHRDIASSHLDVVLFVGDYVYLYDIKGPLRIRRHALALDDEPSLADFRVHHASYKLDADLRAAHAAHPWLLMWDDQEIRNDYDGWTDPQDELEPAAFLALKQRAWRAYFEHLPLSPRRTPTPIGLPMLGDYRWGQLAHLWLLDTRQYRSPRPCSGPLHAPVGGRLLWHCDAMQAPSQSMLGHEQERWLSGQLARSPATWQLLAQTTQISPATLPSLAGPLIYSDGWDAYPGARQRLLDAIAHSQSANVVCLGGDVHRHVAARLRRQANQPNSPVIASEFVTSSITSKGLSEWLNDHVQAGNPDILHCRSDERGYALLDITPTHTRCTFRATDHPVTQHARMRDQARYVITAGVPGPRREA